MYTRLNALASRPNIKIESTGLGERCQHHHSGTIFLHGVTLQVALAVGGNERITVTPDGIISGPSQAAWRLAQFLEANGA